ncbi:T9SS type A sorting domain-containing protein [Bacteroidota bacterium]
MKLQGFISFLLIVINCSFYAQPHLTVPQNGYAMELTTPTLHWWYNTPGREVYNVQISTDPDDFASQEILIINLNVSGNAAGNYFVPQSAGLKNGSVYFWRVGVDGNYSEVWSFTVGQNNTDQTPLPLTIDLIGQGTVTRNPDQSFYIKGTEVLLTAVPDPGWIFSGWNGDTSSTLNPISVNIDITKSINATFSPVGIGGGVLMYPKDSTLGVEVDLTFLWFPYPGAQNYRLMVSEHPEFMENVMDVAKSSSSPDALSHKAEFLESYTTYYWKVVVGTERGNVGSGTWRFTTIDLISNISPPVVRTEMSPVDSDVSQNYPNPFNLSTKFRISVQYSTNVKVDIYNIAGQLVKSLLNKELDSGIYEIEWKGDDKNGTEVVSGNYLYRITAEDKIVSRKMILLK